MEKVYADIAARTGGNIYIGVVGPVRTGKSTIIKRLMETLVIPNIEDPYRKERARDELPQSCSGKTIMTSEPKFIPDEAVEISPDGSSKFKIRMIDSVGYMVNGAVGAEENGSPRMVATPWFDYEIPMTEAAELGTKKVMEEHCTIGLVVTTDGTITDIPRQDYITAEKKAISDMISTGKPFLVIVNSTEPSGKAAQMVQNEIRESFGLNSFAVDCQSIDSAEICILLQQLLFSFPVRELKIYLPRWLDSLEKEHPIKASLYQALLQTMQKITSLGQAEEVLSSLQDFEWINSFSIRCIDLATGGVSCMLAFPESLFYQVLSDRAGITIENNGQLFTLLTDLSATKQAYDKISDALSSAKETGYGIVMPAADQMKLEQPETLKKGGAYGVKLKATAPSIHMIRVDIDTEISPMVGAQQQSEDLIAHLSGEDPAKLWQSNIFGKSVYDLIQEGLTAKLVKTPEEVRSKFRSSLTKIVNEGASGLICLIL